MFRLIVVASCFMSTSGRASDDDLTSVVPSGATPSSDIFCAHDAYYGANTSAPPTYGGINRRWELEYPCPPDMQACTTYPHCSPLSCEMPATQWPSWRTIYDGPKPFCWSDHLITKGKTPTLHRAEIRGWVVSAVGANTSGEDEYSFDVALDTGWQPSVAAQDKGVTPINTLTAVNNYTTPFNVIHFGRRFLPYNNGATFDNAPSFGGLGAGIIHVEVNGWGPARTGGAGYATGDPLYASNNAGGPLFAPPESFTYASIAPTNWVREDISQVRDRYECLESGNAAYQDWLNLGFCAIPVWWPFPHPNWTAIDLVTSPSSSPANHVDEPTGANYANGTYVRLVGDIFLDTPHLEDGVYAKLSWNGTTMVSTIKRGWFEMHSVDFASRLISPAPRRSTRSIAMYASIGQNMNQVSDVMETVRPARPYANSRIANVVFNLSAEWSNFSPSNPLLWTPGSDTFGVNVPVGYGQSFKGAYEVTWTCSPNPCGGGDDGCGGTAAACCIPSCGSAACGAAPDGCGGTIACGSCTTGTCSSNQCINSFDCSACACGCNSGGTACLASGCTTSQRSACTHAGLACVCGGCQ